MKLKTKSYSKPSLLDTYTLRMAATLHQRAESGDPFAYRRIMLHMQQGYELPSDVVTAAENRLKARNRLPEYLG